MAFLNMTIYSDSLMRDTDVSVILPEARHVRENRNGNARYPVIYALHGYGDNNLAWIRKSQLEVVAREFDVVVVMPEGNNSFYINQGDDELYYDYITQELPTKIANYFPVSENRAKTFIMGNSMGGYGAFRIAMSMPERYAAAVSFSGALALSYDKNNVFTHAPKTMAVFDRIFGDHEKHMASDNYLPNLALKLSAYKGDKPRMMHLAGLEDAVTYKAGKVFIDFVTENTNLDVAYIEAHGGHNWSFWSPLIPLVFEFFGFKSSGQKY